jgi:hypothetical protein
MDNIKVRMGVATADQVDVTEAGYQYANGSAARRQVTVSIRGSRLAQKSSENLCLYLFVQPKFKISREDLSRQVSARCFCQAVAAFAGALFVWDVWLNEVQLRAATHSQYTLINSALYTMF